MNDDGKSMSKPERPDDAKIRTILKRSLDRIRELEGQLAAASEPIAIVGMACRFPGSGEDLEGFWDLLADGRDGLSPVPAERWDADALYDEDVAVPGTSVSRAGGFIDGLDLFDAGFFRIAPKEAEQLDPQQRLLLETHWQALENAGIDPRTLKGSRSAVFVGIANSDYRQILGDRGDEASELYTISGTIGSIAAGRIAYSLGLQGPAVAVDTACSASLVAIDEACDALRNGKADLAMAGGVSVMLTPTLSIAFSRAGMLAADGRCKTFDASADGYVRGEGSGVVVLKRLSDAERDRNRILAVIRGGAVNQDGASAALTAPNGRAQERVIAEALQRAGVKASEVDYLEAHGTGTELGDPIEIRAAAAVYGRGRAKENPLLVGSVKTNLGHLETAAGVAGVIKVVLAMQHGTIPKHLNFVTPSPRMDWDRIAVQVTDEATAWPRQSDRPPRAGVSSFGFSGTNAHVIVEAYEPREEGKASDPLPIAWSEEAKAALGAEGLRQGGQTGLPRRHRMLALSGRSRTALGALAQRYLDWIGANADADLADLTYTAGIGRCHFSERAAVVSRSHEELRDGLAKLAEGDASPPSEETEAPRPPKLAFLFTGQGSQYVGMGRDLYQQEPVVRAILDRCDQVVGALRGVSLLKVMFDGEGASLDDTAWTQPALYALEVALVELYRSAGVEPALVLGHSVGELAAAYAAGIFGLEDGLRFVVARGDLMGALPAGGAMAAIFADPTELIGTSDGLEVAAFNGGHHVVSGSSQLVDALIERAAAEGLRCQALQTSHAFHSALMDPMLGRLEDAASSLAAKAPRAALISNVTGRPFDADEPPSGRYWRDHARRPVQFAKSIETLAEEGVNTVLEIGPHPTLSGMLALAWPKEGGTQPRCLASLKRGQDGGAQFMTAIAGLYEQGVDLKHEALYGGEARKRIALPTYPFQRQRYWAKAAKRPTRLPGEEVAHALLGRRTEIARGGVVFETLLSADSPSWAKDHSVHNRVIFPFAAFAEMAHASLRDAAGAQASSVEALHLDLPLALDRPHDVQLLVSESGEIEIFARAQDGAKAGRDGDWVRHAGARSTERRALPESPDQEEIRERCKEAADLGALYGSWEAGPDFQNLEALWFGKNELFCEIRLGEELDGHYQLHPLLLDGGLQAVSWALQRQDRESIFLPVGAERIRLPQEARHWRGGSRLYGHARIVKRDERGGVADLTFLDELGTSVAVLEGLSVRRADRDRFELLLGERNDELLYELEWRVVTPPAAVSAAGKLLLVVGDASSTAAAEDLRSALEDRGVEVVAIDCAKSDRETRCALGRGEEQGAALGGIVWLAKQSRDDDPLASMKGPLSALVALLQDRSSSDARPPLGITVVTSRGVASGPGEAVNPEAAGIWGFVRSIQNEQPDLGLRLVDLGPSVEQGTSDGYPARLLADVILAAGPETQSALRGDVLMAPRLVRSAAGMKIPAGGGRVVVARQGSIDDLRVDGIGPQEPGPGEVALEVRASGLAFRDLLTALDSYPGAPPPLGADVAGIVTAVGAGVAGVSPGEGVFGFAEGSFATRVTVDAALLKPIPSGLDLAAAATLPSAFCTALAAFDLGKLKPGETVLVHAAAGGVGLAAVQVALTLGARVFATTSAPKQAYLRALGIAGVFDSRSTDFAAQVREATEGAGVDLVLNSLTAEGFVQAGLACLKEGGRFVEIGKRDIWSAERVAELRPDVGYGTLALDALIQDAPERVAALLQEVGARVEGGALTPLPRRLFPLSEAPAALRLMQQARHVGKIVLTVPKPALRADRSYLVTGGLGALGLEMAAWLAGEGARHLVLTGRKPPSAAVEARLEELARTTGCRIEFAALDVAEQADVESLIDRFGKGDWPALAGVVHAAGVLDDALLADQSWERMEAVLRPKVPGSWNLHRATRDLDLAFFLLYSSAAATLGSPGQSNYAAANGFLDGLAALRQSLGLAATSIAWGPWSLGMAEDDAIGQKLVRQGLRLLDAAAAHRALATVLAGGRANAVVLDSDWMRMSKSLAGGTGPLLSDLFPKEDRVEESALLQRLKAAPPAERRGLLTRYLQDELCTVLGVADRPGAAVGFFDLGMDSLMAVELKNRVSATLGDACRLTNTLAFDYPSVAKLAEYLASEIASTVKRQMPESQREASSAEGKTPDEKSDDQLMREVSQLLGDLR